MIEWPVACSTESESWTESCSSRSRRAASPPRGARTTISTSSSTSPTRQAPKTVVHARCAVELSSARGTRRSPATQTATRGLPCSLGNPASSQRARSSSAEGSRSWTTSYSSALARAIRSAVGLARSISSATACGARSSTAARSCPRRASTISVPQVEPPISIGRLFSRVAGGAAEPARDAATTRPSRAMRYAAPSARSAMRRTSADSPPRSSTPPVSSRQIRSPRRSPLTSWSMTSR